MSDSSNTAKSGEVSSRSLVLMRHLSTEHVPVATASFTMAGETVTALELIKALDYATEFGEKFKEFKFARWWMIIVPLDCGSLDLSITYNEILISKFNERSLWSTDIRPLVLASILWENKVDISSDASFEHWATEQGIDKNKLLDLLRTRK